MQVDKLTGLLSGATVLASKLIANNVMHTQKYLNDNGINANYEQTKQFLVDKGIPLQEADCYKNDIDLLNLIERYDWDNVARKLIHIDLPEEQKIDVIASYLLDIYAQGCDDTNAINDKLTGC